MLLLLLALAACSQAAPGESNPAADAAPGPSRAGTAGFGLRDRPDASMLDAAAPDAGSEPRPGQPKKGSACGARLPDPESASFAPEAFAPEALAHGAECTAELCQGPDGYELRVFRDLAWPASANLRLIVCSIELPKAAHALDPRVLVFPLAEAQLSALPASVPAVVTMKSRAGHDRRAGCGAFDTTVIPSCDPF